MQQVNWSGLSFPSEVIFYLVPMHGHCVINAVMKSNILRKILVSEKVSSRLGFVLSLTSTTRVQKKQDGCFIDQNCIAEYKYSFSRYVKIWAHKGLNIFSSNYISVLNSDIREKRSTNWVLKKRPRSKKITQTLQH